MPLCKTNEMDLDPRSTNGACPSLYASGLLCPSLCKSLCFCLREPCFWVCFCRSVLLASPLFAGEPVVARFAAPTAPGRRRLRCISRSQRSARCSWPALAQASNRLPKLCTLGRREPDTTLTTLHSADNLPSFGSSKMAKSTVCLSGPIDPIAFLSVGEN